MDKNKKLKREIACYLLAPVFTAAACYPFLTYMQKNLAQPYDGEAYKARVLEKSFNNTVKDSIAAQTNNCLAEFPQARNQEQYSCTIKAEIDMKALQADAETRKQSMDQLATPLKPEQLEIYNRLMSVLAGLSMAGITFPPMIRAIRGRKQAPKPV